VAGQSLRQSAITGAAGSRPCRQRIFASRLSRPGWPKVLARNGAAAVDGGPIGARSAFRRHPHEGVIMSDKSPRKANGKKQGKTLKEKQDAKKLKRNMQAGKSSNIPPTGH
jgi:hypothetical protein